MQVVHFDLTFSGAPQDLVTALPLTPATDVPFKQITFMIDKAAANDAFIGERGAALSTTVYGVRLDPTDTIGLAAYTVGPFATGSVKLGDFAVLGTATQILHILGIAY